MGSRYCRYLPTRCSATTLCTSISRWIECPLSSPSPSCNARGGTCRPAFFFFLALRLINPSDALLSENYIGDFLLLCWFLIPPPLNFFRLQFLVPLIPILLNELVGQISHRLNEAWFRQPPLGRPPHPQSRYILALSLP